MRRWVLALGVIATLAVLTAAAFGALYFTKDTGGEGAVAGQCEHDMFGHVVSLTLAGDHYEMRFDPAWFTSGETANTAAAEDGAVEPGEPVPNDNYRVDEGDRQLMYLVPADASVTVLTREGDPEQLGATPISVAELAQLLDGEAPVELSEGLDTGFWMRYHVDTVCSLDQQYIP